MVGIDFKMPRSCAECRLSFADVCPITGKTQVVKVINGEISSDCPLVEAIPKAEYEARLKADMKAILTEIKLKIAEKSYYDTSIIGNYEDEVRISLVELDDVNDIIQNKIDTLEE